MKPLNVCSRIAIPVLAWLCLATIAPAQEIVPAGQGSYRMGLPPGAKGPPQEIFTAAALKGPVPTSDWCSSLVWMRYSERMYPHPLAMVAEKRGLRIYYPGPQITANKAAIFGAMPHQGNDDLVIGNTAAADFPDARLDGFSDWFVTALFAIDSVAMRLSFGHGSPYVYATYTSGSPCITFSRPPKIWSGDARSATIGLSVGSHHYALFGPAGSTWEGLGQAQLINRAGAAKRYFSVALLPDDRPATLALFARHAHNHVTGTRITWSYDAKTSSVKTEYRFTIAPREGNATGTLSALYPHQWRNTDAPLPGGQYASVRGPMKLWQGASFATTMRYPGVLPVLPGDADAATMQQLLAREAERKVPGPRDTYAEGKWLGRTAILSAIAERYQQPALADTFRGRLKERLRQWFTASTSRRTTQFCYDRRWGTLIGEPASYGSDTELNDHHFHYGYFLMAAAEVARRDPAFVADSAFGPMVRLLVRDIASPDRDDPMFPFLRCFDPYAGHSWASGHARFGDGNNQESSSESMNAWAGLIELGAYTGDTRLRDLGIYLYTTEMNAIQEYWFNVHGDTFPPGYPPSVVTMVWGGKGANGTWFSARPEHVHGINCLPMTGTSLYLGLYPGYAKKNWQAMIDENQGQQPREWVDVLWMYEALSDPGKAMEHFQAAHAGGYRGEGGNSEPNTLNWIDTLLKDGLPDRTITADTPLYAVLTRQGRHTYIVYNPAAAPLPVRFSDGHELTAAPGTFTISRPGAKQ